MTDSAGLSPLQRRALQAMDIDLYVTRTAAAIRDGTSHPSREGTSHSSREDKPASPQTATASDRAASRSVAGVPPAALAERDRPVAAALDCLAGGGVVVIGGFADAADARFAQDVLAALVGNATEVQKNAFRWPQTQTGDRSRAAAQRAYAGFLNGQTERAGARLLLLFGAAATMLLPAERADAGYALVECAAIGELRRDAAQKKALWLSIRRYANR